MRTVFSGPPMGRFTPQLHEGLAGIVSLPLFFFAFGLKVQTLNDICVPSPILVCSLDSWVTLVESLTPSVLQCLHLYDKDNCPTHPCYSEIRLSERQGRALPLVRPVPGRGHPERDEADSSPGSGKGRPERGIWNSLKMVLLKPRDRPVTP